MNRLLFAAARGARIERRHFKFPLWESSRVILVTDPDKTDTDYDYRIHPDDEAYQYGPISTALRKKAENNTWCSGWEWFLAEAAANEFTEFFDSRIAEPDYPLFYLILAEALADEGM
jgi:hypothetical protein